jgi:hypothetical protein
MNEFWQQIDPAADFDALNPLRDDAVRYEAVTRQGRPCALIDNTGRWLPAQDVLGILDGLVANQAFGFRARSPAGAGTVSLDQREAAHVQVGDDLYRLIICRYEARIEPF